MSRKADNLTHIRYGHLVVLHRDTNKGRHIYWVCKCDCGALTSVSACNLYKTNTCGCRDGVPKWLKVWLKVAETEPTVE